MRTVITHTRAHNTVVNPKMHILSALESMCKRCGLTSNRKKITSSRSFKKENLDIHDINLAGKT